MYLSWRLLTIVSAVAILPPSYAQENIIKLNAEGAGRYVLEGRIAPTWVTAPPRRVDVSVARDPLTPPKTSSVTTHSLGFSAIPFEINAYPVASYPLGLGSALELDLGLFKRESTEDVLLRIGDPALFPDMLAQQLDFRGARFVPKNLAYKLKRKLRMKGDGSWRYTVMGAEIKQISHGEMLATFGPKGEIVIQKDLTGIDLATSPWLRYQYELPSDDLPWLMQFEIKVKLGPLNPGLLRLVSQPIKGGGRQTIMVNLLDMLKQVEPRAQGGKLEELIIHIAQGADSDWANDVKINLGTVAFYRQYIPAGNGKKQAHLVAVSGGEVNLMDIPGIAPMVWGGRLLSLGNPVQGGFTSYPIRFSASYQEQLPALFVGHAEYLDGLNAQELDAVLDQKMFLEKRILWQQGLHLPVSLAPTSIHSLTAETPLAQYTPQVRLEGDAYIKADYTLRDKENRRVYLLMKGKNLSGGIVELEHLVSPGKLLRVKDITLNNLEFVLRPHLSGSSQPSFFQMNNVEVSSYVKAKSYQIKPSEAYFILDDAPSTIGDPLWRVSKKSLPFHLDKAADLNLISVFPVNLNFQAESLIRLALQKPTDPDLELFLKIEGENALGGNSERLYPIIEGRLNKVIKHAISRVSIFGRSPHGVLYQRNSGAQLGLEFLTIESLGKPENYVPLMLPSVAVGDATTSGGYGAALLRAPSVLANRIDTTLSLEEIWRGGKKLIFSTQYLSGGPHIFNYLSENGVAFEVKELQAWDEYAAANTGLTPKPAPREPAKLRDSLLKLFLILASIVAIVFLWRRWGYAAAQAFDRVQSTPLAFYITQLVLWASGIYFAFFTSNLDAASWGGVIMVLAYGLAVRYKLRPYFASKWPYFVDKKSAPYFVMVLATLALIALMLILKREFIAEIFAVIAYYLLILGVIIEFIQFSKEAPLQSQK